MPLWQGAIYKGSNFDSTVLINFHFCHYDGYDGELVTFNYVVLVKWEYKSIYMFGNA